MQLKGATVCLIIFSYALNVCKVIYYQELGEPTWFLATPLLFSSFFKKKEAKFIFSTRK